MSSPDPDPFLVKIGRSLARYRMVTDPQVPILVACSAGADSVCLAHALHRLEIPIALAHFDHGLRGAEGHADGDAVEAIADAFGVPCHRGRADEDLGGEGDSMEMSAREARYSFLCACARENSYSAIATAHHLDDQAETVIMRILRGTSPRGLSGIPAVGQHEDVPVIRPLIDSTRAEIRSWLAVCGATVREDPSNKDTSILRNRVRHELIPGLERDYNPHVRDALLRLSALAHDDDELLTAAAADFARGVFDSEGAILHRKFNSAPAPLQRRVLSAWFDKRGIEPTFDRIESARAHILAAGTGKRLSLSETVALEKTRIRTRFIDPTVPDLPRTESFPLRNPGTTEALGHVFTVEPCALPKPPYASQCDDTQQVFDADRLGHAISVRTWVEGDRIEPLGLDGSKKLQDWFTDAGVPRSDRASMALVLAGNQIAWIPGGPVAAPFTLTRDSVRALRIRAQCLGSR